MFQHFVSATENGYVWHVQKEDGVIKVIKERLVDYAAIVSFLHIESKTLICSVMIFLIPPGLRFISALPVPERIRRAEQAVRLSSGHAFVLQEGVWDHHVLWHNCEHFVMWCVFGHLISQQVDLPFMLLRYLEEE